MNKPSESNQDPLTQYIDSLDTIQLNEALKTIKKRIDEIEREKMISYWVVSSGTSLFSFASLNKDDAIDYLIIAIDEIKNRKSTNPREHEEELLGIRLGKLYEHESQINKIYSAVHQLPAKMEKIKQFRKNGIPGKKDL